jgi:hypothetical protein
MNIRLVTGRTELHGTLDTAAGRDFASLLPLTLTLSDFHSTEKIADLPRTLETSGAPTGVAAAAGDITYYAPWGNLALFYRDFPYSDGLVRLGRFDDDTAAAFLAELPKGTAVTLEVTT